MFIKPLTKMVYNQVFFLLCCVAFCIGDQFEDKCGLEAADSMPLVKGGRSVKGNQFPWHVAIFLRKGNHLEQICGGSLVRSNLVISAAHCFSDRSHSHQVHLADYRVVGGIRLSSWNSTEIGRQESEVQEVRLGEEYGGSIRNFEDDIAIVQLMTAFTFSDKVRAVCLDLADADLNTRHTSPGSMGKVAGWGLTESDTTSESLNFLRVPVVAREECFDKLPSGFKSYLTSDKICAGLTNGAGCRVRGSVGVCRNISDCPGAKQDVLLGFLPQYCWRPGLEICCEEPSCPPLPNSTVSLRKTGSKAVDYCVDLAEKFYPCQKQGSRWSRGDLCGPEPYRRESRHWLSSFGKASAAEVQRYMLLEVEPQEGLPVYLVSERWFLARATQLDNYLPSLWGPVQDKTTSIEPFAINRRVRHPQFIKITFRKIDYDIELVEMDKPVIFSWILRPFCLHMPQDSLEDLTLSRWGKFGEIPANLLPQEECSRLYTPGSYYAPEGATDAHMCVNFTSGCDHYSKYYLTANNGKRVACTRLLVGIHLGGVVEDSTCVQLFLRVAHYIPWIESVVWP